MIVAKKLQQPIAAILSIVSSCIYVWLVTQCICLLIMRQRGLAVYRAECLE